MDPVPDLVHILKFVDVTSKCLLKFHVSAPHEKYLSLLSYVFVLYFYSYMPAPSIPFSIIVIAQALFQTKSTFKIMEVPEIEPATSWSVVRLTVP